MAKHGPPDTTVCRNRKAAHEYHLLDTIECGMVLVGTEVKSLRDKAASLDEAYARIERDELWLIGCHIAAYAFGHINNHDPTRRRKLLARRQELRKLKPKVEQKGLTLVPLRIYFSERGLAKVTIALAKGKSHGDKRESHKTRDHQREMDRALRRGGS